MPEAPHLPDWLAWARELQAIAQTGIRYASDERFGGNPFDVERYERVRAIAASMLADRANLDPNGVLDVLTAQAGDATPKVDVRGAVFDAAGRILLVRELMDEGRWTLPGGWADPNESPSRAAEREVREETGYEARATKVIAVLDRDRHHPPSVFSIYKLFFLCELLGGTAADSRETAGARFFTTSEVRGLELSSGRTTPAQIERCFAHHRDASLPTEFD